MTSSTPLDAGTSRAPKAAGSLCGVSDELRHVSVSPGQQRFPGLVERLAQSLSVGQ